MHFVRLTSVGLVVLLLSAVAGCGGGGGSSEPVVDETRPDAGLEASKKLQQMQPLPLPGKKARR
ncbi:hypothetical protein ACYOEI_11095 [Singulisphaera rosea]